MSSRAFEQPNDELEAQLSALGSRIAWAPTPDLAHAVLASHTQPAPREIWDRRRTWLAVAAILLLLSGTLLASSSIRSTVADFLGIEGLRIELGESVTTPAAHPNLGTPTSMQDFQHWLPFAPMQPDTLGGPDAVYLRVLENGDTLGTMVWNPSDTLPEAAETGLGAVLMQFDPPEDIVMLLKTVAIPNGRVMETNVKGSPAYWVEGASDLTIFGDDTTETRATANALIWQEGSIGFRFESALSMEEALAIAESMGEIEE